MIEAADIRDQLSTLDELTLSRLAASVVKQWERLTGRTWVLATAKDFILTPDVNDVFIWSPLYPISALVVKEWFVDQLEADAVTTPTTDYRFAANSESGKITRLRQDLWRDYVKLTVTGGYMPATTPADVRDAMLAQAVHAYTKNKPNRAGVTTESHGKSGSATYDNEPYHKDFKEAAAAYRRI